jgi:tRNA nucleotidyltransferase (CCA-adding enzyme)
MMDRKAERALHEVCHQVLEWVVPPASERRDLLQYSEHLVATLTDALRQSSVEAEVHIQGSIAKDTWLAGEKDIDVFISLPPTQTKDAFPKVLDVVKAFLGTKWVEAYAEHPYLKAEVNGYQVDFVPCFQIEWAGHTISAVDRTPLHTSYVLEHLAPQAANEVRLLKQFMRGIGVYGAEIRVGGFSGYLCELLILQYATFPSTMKQASQWPLGVVIDPANQFAERVDEVHRLFDAPLIVVDPVDPHRNVAAAVASERLGEFITAARTFLERPRLDFFYPPPSPSPTPSCLTEQFATLGFDVIVAFFAGGRLVPDVLWGQLYKSLRALRSLLGHHGFQVLKTAAWSDEEAVNAFLFGLESRVLPSTTRHFGPPFDSRDATNFLARHVTADTTVIGPWIEDTRWVVGMKRQYTDAVTLLREKLANGGREAGVATRFIDVIPASLDLKVNAELVDFAASNEAFARVLLDFLSGRPRWLG